MRILLTGATGLIGMKLLPRLIEGGDHVLAIYRNPTLMHKLHDQVTWIQGDLSKNQLDLSFYSPIDAVIHLAGTGWAGGARLDINGEDNLFLSDNECTIVNVLNSIHGSGCKKFVIASSQVVYGWPNSLAVTEDFSLRVTGSAYACSKINVENWAKNYHMLNGGTFFLLRFAGFINGGGFIDYLIDKSIESDEIDLFQNGQVIRDYLTVDDAVNSILMAVKVESPDCKFIPINIGSGQAYTALELAEIVRRSTFSSSKINLLGVKSDQGHFLFSIEKAKSYIGYHPLNLSHAVAEYAFNKYSISKI